MQTETGASVGSPHKGLVENLVEKAKEILPHQLTGVGPAPASTGNSAADPYAWRENATVGALPSLVGLLYCDKAWSELYHAAMHLGCRAHHVQQACSNSLTSLDARQCACICLTMSEMSGISNPAWNGKEFQCAAEPRVLSVFKQMVG